ncbi:MAG: hypothetical protein LIO58_00280 [Oscillospiraceae bacterium]|nr:hypothetical protein [Oscillospiraceae bacterium]
MYWHFPAALQVRRDYGPIRGDGGLGMEYLDLVNKIVAAEQSAQEIVKEAETKETTLDTDVEKEIARLREDYMSRAKRRLEAIEKTEQDDAQDDIRALDKDFEAAMARINRAYHENKARWIQTLFDEIAGDGA